MVTRWRAAIAAARSAKVCCRPLRLPSAQPASGTGYRNGEPAFGFAPAPAAAADCCLLLGALELWPGNEELPAEQHDHAEHDGQNHIAIVFIISCSVAAAGRRLLVTRSGCVHAQRCKAPRSATSLRKGFAQRIAPSDQHIVMPYMKVIARKLSQPREDAVLCGCVLENCPSSW
jgi:hypothetical protein